MLQSIVFSTLGELATGILFFIAFVPPSKIGKGFGRFHAGLVLALWIVAQGNHPSFTFWILVVFLLLTFLVSSKDALFYPSLLLSLAASLNLLLAHDAAQFGISGALMIHFPAALVLGASSVSMLLGHWYLVAPKLPISYLKVLTVGLIGALLLRTILLVSVMISGSEKLASLHFYDIYGIFFLQRVVLGLLLTLILSMLTYFCVRIRSTQSATGILYVVVVFCLIGEVIGSYLFAKTGLSF